MTAPRKQPTSSPRFPRGLVLLLWSGMAGLLVFGIVHRRAENNSSTTPPASSIAKKSQLVANEKFSAPVVRKKTPRELLLEKSLAAITAETDAERREGMLEKFAAEISVADIELTLEELRHIEPEEIAGDLVQRLLRCWAASDGRAAAAWATALPSGQLREQALSDVAVEWSNTNLLEATGWAKTLGDETERTAAISAVAGEAVRSQPLMALQIALDLPASQQRGDLIQRGAMQWASEDAASAVAWVRQIPAGDVRNQTLSGVAIVWSASAPVDAATWALNELPPGRLLDDTVVSIVQRWAQRDMDGATAWVEQFPEGALRAAAVENLLAQWSPTDPEGAQR